MNIVQALLFYPRGGSAQVVRYLSAALNRQGAHVRIVTGSLGAPGERTHAGTFFKDLDLAVADYSPAVERWNQGGDPLAAAVPLHPSYEDRAGVPDRIFTSVSPALAEHLEAAWVRFLCENIREAPDVFHVHHLTPLQAAVRACFPDTPIVGHLHGTELKMLAYASRRLAIAERLGIDLLQEAETLPSVAARYPHLLTAEERDLAADPRPEQWRYARLWVDRMKGYAAMCDRLIVLNEQDKQEIGNVLGFDPEMAEVIPNGVDLQRFYPDAPSLSERRARWRTWLVDDPQGWDETGAPGTVRYNAGEADSWFFDEAGSPRPVLLYVGRFTNMKRVPLLIRAYARAKRDFAHPAPLVIWGGYPGEWEDEHPVGVARQLGVSGVFFTGWRGHEELPLGLNAADVMVAPSVNEPFGQVYLEAMACGLPVIATPTGGPRSFVNVDPDMPNGWMTGTDDIDSLAEAMTAAVNDPDERRRRGKHALALVRQRYSWDGIARRFHDIYSHTLERFHR